MKTRHTTNESTWNNLPINTSDGKYKADLKILQELKDQFEYAEKTKSKIFFMRLDYHSPADQPHVDNKVYSEAQGVIHRYLTRKGLKPQSVTVKEQSREKHDHFHSIFLLDGQKVKSILPIAELAERTWDRKMGFNDGCNHGLVDRCTVDRNGERQANGIMLIPGSPDYEQKKAECFYWSSYLAKTNQKSNKQIGEREMFSTRIPKDNQPENGSTIE